MATRCGALDPGVVLHLIKDKGMSADEVATCLHKKSGLFGVSGDASMATEQGIIALVVIYSLFPTVMKMIAISLVWSFSLAAGEIAETEHLQQEM